MQQYLIDNDIPMICAKAASFPAGIPEAFDKLNSTLAPHPARRYWAFSRPEGNNIAYWAAAEPLNSGEMKNSGLDTIMLKAGKYTGALIANFMKDTAQIGAAFQQLLHQPGIDPNGYCVERYINDDVICMVRMA